MATKDDGPRVAFLTGCSDGGIGGALAAEFLQRGLFVYASARSLASMSALVSHKNLIKLQVDVTDDASVEAAVQRIYDTDGRQIDFLVLNAGVACALALLDVPLERTQTVLDTNFFGFIRFVNLVGPKMVTRGKGVIMPIGSVNGELPCPFLGAYNASKAAMHTYAETLTGELKPFGVHVMLVSPGAVKTKLVANAGKFSEMPKDSIYQRYSKQIIDISRISLTAKDSMDPAKFANLVLDKALMKNPPTYFTAGGLTRRFYLLSWLNRPTALRLVWKSLVEDA